MQDNRSILIAFGALTCGICAVALFGWSVWRLRSEDAVRLSESSVLADTSGAFLTAAREHSLALLVSSSTERIDTALHIDAVAISRMVSSVGASTHVALTINDVSPALLPTKTAGAVSTLHAYDMTVTGEGSFGALMQTQYALEHLALPARVQSAEIELSAPSEAGAAHAPSAPRWRMNVHLRVITSAQPTS